MRSTVNLHVNGEPVQAEIEHRQLLVDFLRDDLGLTGTHTGCDTSQCGACTVWIDGVPARSCQAPIGALAGRQVTTIEGLAGEALHPVQEAWIEHDVAQCGYCQAGQIMSAAALLQRNPKPSTAEIDAAMSGNLCRCGTYTRIAAAIASASDKLAAQAFYEVGGPNAAVREATA